MYWFIHTIREIALLDIKSLCEQLDLRETLTRVRSTRGFFNACAPNDSNSPQHRKFKQDIKCEIQLQDDGISRGGMNEAGPLIACLPPH